MPLFPTLGINPEVLGTGPATGPTSAPEVPTISSVGSSIGSILGRAITGGSAIGDALGGILGAVGGSVVSDAVLPGRTGTPVTAAATTLPAVVGQAGRAMNNLAGGAGVAGAIMGMMGMRVRIPAGLLRSVRVLVPAIGIEAAAAALNLGISQIAMLFVRSRRRRRRGISAADIRRTYRTLNTVSRIQHKLSGAGICRRTSTRRVKC